MLAGGRSRRLGEDKARLALNDGQPLILTVVQALRAVCDDVVVVTDRAGRFKDIALPAGVVTDTIGGRGPLGGLHAGLCNIDTPFALAVACDMPFLNKELLRFMAGLPRDYELLVPRAGGRWQMTHAIYARSCLSPVESLLSQRRGSLLDLLSKVAVTELEEAQFQQYDPAGLSFFNLNSPKDLVEGRAILAGREREGFRQQ